MKQFKIFKISEMVFVAVWLMIAFGCGQNVRNKQIGSNNSNSNADSLANDSFGHYMEFKTLSNEDLWLRVNPSSNSNIIQRLLDAYNASVVQNSLLTDFDLQMRGYDLNDVIKAIKSIDVTIVKDEEVLNKLKAYKNEMLYLLSVNPDSINQEIHNPWLAKDNLYTYLSKKYSVHTFGILNEDQYWDEYYYCPSVPEWAELREKRGNGNMIEELKEKYNDAKDFDARCIYAIELGHAYEADLDTWESADGSFQNPAIPIMESLMNSITD